MCQKRFPSVDEIRLHCEEHRREAEKVQNKSIPEVEDEIVCLDDSIGMIYKIFFRLNCRISLSNVRGHLNYYLSGAVCPSECLSAKKKLLNGCTYQKMLV